MMDFSGVIPVKALGDRPHLCRCLECERPGRYFPQFTFTSDHGACGVSMIRILNVCGPCSGRFSVWQFVDEMWWEISHKVNSETCRHHPALPHLTELDWFRLEHSEPIWEVI